MEGTPVLQPVVSSSEKTDYRNRLYLNNRCPDLLSLTHPELSLLDLSETLRLLCSVGGP